ncbi:MAG: redoxin [Acidobacteria bacterium RIFCSPLOWO2_02_FULL_65_29]|nr:MAG: redoxin [Acidobacteria bacterium RIFCSPLOWO2_02_FULL_65_29]
MAYRESTRTTAPARDAASASSNKTGFAFNIYPQPRALPNVRFADGNGRGMTLRDLRGKVILLNVWATWCPPCRKEMPTLDRLQAKLGGPDFEVVALSIDRGGPFVVRAFYEEIGISALPIYLDETTDAATELGVVALPVTLLIDREGREIGRKIGPAEWDSPEIVTLIRGYIVSPVSNRPEKK